MTYLIRVSLAQAGEGYMGRHGPGIAAQEILQLKKPSRGNKGTWLMLAAARGRKRLPSSHGTWEREDSKSLVMNH